MGRQWSNYRAADQRLVGTAALGKGRCELRKVRLSVCRRVQGLDDNVQVSPAGQTQLLGFFRGNPVLEKLRAIGGQLACGQFLQQIIFHTAARQRSNHVACTIAGEQRTNGAGR